MPAHRRSLAAPLVAALGIAVTVGAWRLTSGYEERTGQRLWRHEFDEQARSEFVVLERTIATELSAMNGLSSFYDSSAEVERDEFRIFTSAALRRSTSIRSLAWAPRVPSDRLDAFQAQVRAQGLPDYTVQVAPADGDARQPVDRYPVLFVEPQDEHEETLGVGLGTVATRLATLEAARDLGELQASPTFSLGSGGDSEPAFDVVAPVYRHGHAPASPEERQAALVGVIVGTYQVRGLLRDGVGREHGADTGQVFRARDLVLYVYDGGAPGTPLLLAEDGTGHHHAAPSLTVQEARAGTFLARNVSILNRSWIVVARPLLPLNPPGPGPLSILTALAGLVVTGLLAVYVRTLVDQSRRVEDEVDARTRELAETTRDLRLSEARLRAIFASAADGFLVVGRDGRIRAANPGAEHILGYGDGELVGVQLSELIPEPLRQEHTRRFAEIIEGADNTVAGGRREVSARRRDGTVFPMDLAVSALEMGDEVGFLGVIRDISGVKAVERLKDQFISTVSHELRTPLTSIIGSLELLKDGLVGVLPPKAQRMIEVALDNSDRLLWLINDILDIEKLESGRVRLNVRALDAATMLREASVSNQSFADMHGVELGVVDYTEDVMVLGDRDRLMQVLTNLIANAVKFSPLGGEVALGFNLRGEQVVFWVRDEGPGIPESFRSRVFAPFSQADGSDTRRAGGTGLGLSIAKSLVEAHGGTIWFETELGAGTTFCFSLPRVSDEDALVPDPDTEIADPSRA